MKKKTRSIHLIFKIRTYEKPGRKGSYIQGVNFEDLKLQVHNGGRFTYGL